MAKAVEDTFFYRRGDYLAANEVGASPFWTPGGVGRFHAMMQDRASQMPHGLSATSTHDTKRGEDARARLHVVSEAPDVWAAAVDRWHGMNAESMGRLPAGEEPDAPVEQFLYQSLLGVWPVAPLGDEGDLISLHERMVDFAVKALREAKLRTSWDDPNERYEAAIKAFLGDLLEWHNRSFLGDFEKTAGPFIHAGLINSLSQTLVKLTAPGIPDIYQGSERIDLSLVDPDNRRGFSPRGSLSQLPQAPTIGDFEDCKQRLISIGLNYRRGAARIVLREANIAQCASKVRAPATQPLSCVAAGMALRSQSSRGLSSARRQTAACPSVRNCGETPSSPGPRAANSSPCAIS
jgi:(1->4)-alpha-D-glucan 1-alpha-D-glucosylmutase